MNVLTTAVASPLPQSQDYGQVHDHKELIPENSLHEAFAARVAAVDRLIDEKTDYIMESARLRSLAESSPEGRERYMALVQTLDENSSRLQEIIDRELKGLVYALQKAPAPSPFLDELPG